MKGKIIVLGIGQGPEHLSDEIRDALSRADVIFGHELQVEQVKEYFPENAEILDNKVIRGDSQDFEDLNERRTNAVVAKALEGKTVVTLNGGDAGIWGAAPYYVEAVEEYPDLDVEVIPGISSIFSAAAMLGAPINYGFIVLSICDEWLPFPLLQKRAEMAAQLDIPIVLLKPVLETTLAPKMFPEEKYGEFFPPEEVSRKQFQSIVDILLTYRSPDTPVGIVSDIKRQSTHLKSSVDIKLEEFGREGITLCTLSDLTGYNTSIKYFTIIIVGGEMTRKVGNYLVSTHWYPPRRKIDYTKARGERK
ncbi:MAG: hypothetical protein HXS53_08495 [Theionarchaea archaeon]|nr:hypothetical protein [Theionarchaea archaeon]